MNRTVRRGFTFGLIAGVILLVGIACWTVIGVIRYESTFHGEIYGFGIMLMFIAGIPTSLPVNAVAVLLWERGSDELMPLFYGIFAISVLANWIMVGTILGWIFSIFKRKH